MVSIGTQLRVDVINLAEVQQYLDELPEDTFNKSKNIFTDAVFVAHGTVAKNLTTKLKIRTGTLARSVRTEVEGTKLKNLRASLYGARDLGGKQLVYTLTQEFGATIKAKRAYKGVPGGPYLNIPIGSNLTPAGVQRLGAREVFNQGGYIVGRTVMLKGEVMFALVKQVKIPPRLGMRDAVDEQIPTVLSSLQKLLGED